jgi:hypothetical protein
MDCPAALPSAWTRRRDGRGDFLGNRRRVAICPCRRSPARAVREAAVQRQGSTGAYGPRDSRYYLRHGFSGELEGAKVQRVGGPNGTPISLELDLGAFGLAGEAAA